MFWIAVALIGSFLGVMTAVLLQLVAGWAFALPLCLFENTSPRECLRASNRVASGQRLRIVAWIAGWFLCNTAAAALVTSLVVAAGQITVKFASASVWSAILAVGI